MGHDRLTLFGIRLKGALRAPGPFDPQPHPHLLRAGAAQTQLFGEVAAKRARDEQHRFAIFDRLLELSMRAREKRRTPGRELVRLEATREQDSMAPVAAELALQLARADCRHRAQRAKTKQVKAFELLSVERKLVSGEGSEEGLRGVDLHETARSRARRGEPGRERSWRKTQSRLAADGGAQAAASLSNRFARVDDSTHVQPRDAFDADLDRRGQVVEGRRDELS